MGRKAGSATHETKLLSSVATTVITFLLGLIITLGSLPVETSLTGDAVSFNMNGRQHISVNGDATVTIAGTHDFEAILDDASVPVSRREPPLGFSHKTYYVMDKVEIDENNTLTVDTRGIKREVEINASLDENVRIKTVNEGSYVEQYLLRALLAWILVSAAIAWYIFYRF